MGFVESGRRPGRAPGVFPGAAESSSLWSHVRWVGRDVGDPGTAHRGVYRIQGFLVVGSWYSKFVLVVYVGHHSRPAWPGQTTGFS